jgi:predicted phosphodiesterase
MSQLDEARIIAEYKKQGKTFNDIGEILGKNGEACRSTLRRYQSDLNNDISLLNILDNEINEDKFTSKRSEEVCKAINDAECLKKYGAYFVINDLHEPYTERKVLKRILLDPEVRKIKTCIVNGDLLQLDVASKFPVDKDEVIKESIEKGSEILEVLASEFEEVIVIEGNHDRHAKRELLKSVKNGLKFLIKDVYAIQSIINDLYEKHNIKNIKFTFGNELKLGNVYFAHPDYYTGVPGQTVIGMADSYLAKDRSVNAVIIGHTHAVHSGIYKDIAVYECGCLCKDMDYIKGAQKRKSPWVLAYSIFTIKPDGDLDRNKSKVITVV